MHGLVCGRGAWVAGRSSHSDVHTQVLSTKRKPQQEAVSLRQAGSLHRLVQRTRWQQLGRQARQQQEEPPAETTA